MEIRLAAASIAFSINSFTTEAGRSITSPAAIWLARCSERILIVDKTISGKIFFPDSIDK
jgi:hypothetical protein